LDLAFQLVWSPASVAKGHEDFLRVLAPMSNRISTLEVIDSRSLMATVSGRW
jgi:hypothetical protein